jgi:hypothetical protein
MTRTVQDHLPPLPGEERQDEGHPIAHVLLELLQRLVIEPHHRRVQGEDGLLGDHTRARRPLIGNDDAQEFRDRPAVPSLRV